MKVHGAITIALVVAVQLFAAQANAGVIPLMLFFSTSELDPWVRDMEPFTGARQVHVWLLNYDWTEIEFGIDSSFEIINVFVPHGITNVGTLTEPHLVADEGCGLRDAVVLHIAVRDSLGLGGHICPRGSATSDRMCASTCDTWYNVDHYEGLDTAPGQCEGRSTSSNCFTQVAIDAATWGKMKAEYRPN